MNHEHPPVAYSQDPMDPAPLCIVIRNYRDGTQQTMGNSHNDRAQPPNTGYDLLIAIDAPEQLPASDSALQIYLDPSDTPTRPRHGNASQVHSAQEMDPVVFSTWAHEVAELLARLMLEQGLVCVDLVDLARVFSQSREPFNCLLCDWSDPHRLPDDLQGKTFTLGVWVVFACPTQLDTALFEKAGALFDQILSAEGTHLAAARLQTSSLTKLLFIGS